MINAIEQEAVNFRKDHKNLAAKVDSTREDVRKGLNKPTALKRAAANIAYLAGAGINTVTMLEAGPVVSYKAAAAEDAYDENIRAAGEHKDKYLDQYIEMAKADPLNKPKTIGERLKSGELRFLTNMPSDEMAAQGRERQEYLDDLYLQYGEDGVITGNAMVDDQPLGRPGMYGVYVSAARWDELHQEPSGIIPDLENGHYESVGLRYDGWNDPGQYPE